MRVERHTLLSACCAGSPFSRAITTIPQSRRVSSASAHGGATPPWAAVRGDLCPVPWQGSRSAGDEIRRGYRAWESDRYPPARPGARSDLRSGVVRCGRWRQRIIRAVHEEQRDPGFSEAAQSRLQSSRISVRSRARGPLQRRREHLGCLRRLPAQEVEQCAGV
jgi:hypothetical protein